VNYRPSVPRSLLLVTGEREAERSQQERPFHERESSRALASLTRPSLQW
jgi:hypothetical protein